MREWARRYMHRSLMVMHSTFGTNKHLYILFAVLAIGEQSQGVPVAFVITRFNTTESITEALEQFVTSLDAGTSSGRALIRPSTIITDDSMSEQAACSKLFPDAKQALCAYYVRTAIQKTLCNKKLQGR
jgi:hypothetical protein